MSTVLGEQIGEDRHRRVAMIGHSSFAGSLALAQVVALVSSMGYAVVDTPAHVPDMPMVRRSQPKRHGRHQGAKERMKRLQKLGHTHHCAARVVWGDGECECQKKAAEAVRG